MSTPFGPLPVPGARVHDALRDSRAGNRRAGFPQRAARTCWGEPRLRRTAPQRAVLRVVAEGLASAPGRDVCADDQLSEEHLFEYDLAP